MVPVGTFRLSRRFTIATTRPFVIRGASPDASRFVWTGDATEGIAIKPSGKAEPLMNDALVTITGTSEREALCC